MRPRVVLWLITILMLLAVYIDLPKLPIDLRVPGIGINLNNYLGYFPLNLGLDLQGGAQLILQTKMDALEPQSRDDALESSRKVIERRVNLFGVSEAIVQTSKAGEERRILVELPGIKDSSQAAELVGKTAQLEFMEYEIPEGTDSAVLDPFSAKPTGLTGVDLRKASVTFGNQGVNSGPQVAIEFTEKGAQKFAEITKRNVGRPLGMYLDGVPISWPPPTL